MNGRIAALDGLRGLAIGLVVCLHLFGRPLTGWMGVDLFFVLSGYLITTILLRERHEVFFWKIFYTRRVTRILPAYLILLGAAAVLTPLPWRQIWPFYTFFAANFAYLAVGQAGIGVLLVLWSLAVEEHFYLIWPGVMRLFGERTLAWILVGVIVAEPVARVAGMRFTRDFFVFYSLTPFRFDGIAMGSLLALVLAQPVWRRRLARWVGPLFYVAMGAGFLVLMVLRLTREHDTLFFNVAGYTVVGFAATMLLAWLILRPESGLARGFGLAPLRFLGGISFSLYLYHVLIQNECEVAARRLGLRASYGVEVVALVLSILTAWASTEWVERRFMEYGRGRVRAYRARETRVAEFAAR